ncbi:efflux RND transporter periplasmic adaptor subunit [Pseudomonas sp. ABC1]|uniref:efflux RND transporter periplasmic adaptor subunit n=1 Tax=Pseudomonas sp. ABC1 TaxID=2748080 RepID=UPI0015C35B90|nr:efflux RND transporter periplasmic adaptor subunit [Pseudomonas sp. ABC1]QLF93461.1 efflux RND transporter periplasmic adaptor subunit [Pseudomonas sp. ABC1]
MKRPLPLLTIALAILLAGCGQAQDAAPAAAPLPTVETITTEARPLTLSSELPGRIEPVRVAEVRARVAGILLKRYFEEGADVKAGQVLFQIDPAPFKAALSRAQGELARAEATLYDAQAVVRRYTPLVEIEAVSQQDFDTAQAALKSAQAARQSAAAEVETARLNLGYATVTAPIDGRIGRALATEGALVGQNEATALANIQQLDPIYADFRQPVADLLNLRDAIAEGRLTGENGQVVPISVSVEGTRYTRDGHLLFSDITVDRGTGQVSLRGQLANPDALLLPGMYVRVRIAQGSDPQAILVPQRAVRLSTDGKSQVLVVGEGDVVQARPVRTGAMYGADWHILEGLQAGERVIVGGSANPGDQVAIASAAAPAAND